jgi:hypothetical protein
MPLNNPDTRLVKVVHNGEVAPSDHTARAISEAALELCAIMQDVAEGVPCET